MPTTFVESKICAKLQLYVMVIEIPNWENLKEIAFESTMGHFNFLFLMASKANLASLSKVFLSAMHNYLIEW